VLNLLLIGGTAIDLDGAEKAARAASATEPEVRAMFEEWHAAWFPPASVTSREDLYSAFLAGRVSALA
jgi:hypothetical protein